MKSIIDHVLISIAVGLSIFGFILVGLSIFGFILMVKGMSNTAADSCDKLHKFSHDGVVYDCKRSASGQKGGE